MLSIRQYYLPQRRKAALKCSHLSRFIIYVLPVLNVVAAEGAKRVFNLGFDKPSFWRKLFAICAVGHLLVNLAFTAFMVYVSHQNYPGKIAILDRPGIIMTGFIFVCTILSKNEIVYLFALTNAMRCHDYS